MIRLEDFIIANEVQVIFCNAELFRVQICLLVVPLHHDHRPLRVLRAPTLRKDLADSAYDGALLRLSEEDVLADAVDDAEEHELPVDRQLRG